MIPPLVPDTAFDTVVIVGGGCYGSYYVRQIGRAVRAGALRVGRVAVVDRDTECAVARMPGDHSIIVSEWDAFLDSYLEREDGVEHDAMVPSPLMPHLLYGWLERRATARWPARSVRTVPLTVPPPTPWVRAAPDGTTYASFATWTCPVNCIEPARCPHTRGPRDWTMPAAARALVQASAASAEPLDGPVIFHCTHRAYGVGMIDMRDVVRADGFVTERGARGAARILVGTVSHCHGAFNVLEIGVGGGCPENNDE